MKTKTMLVLCLLACASIARGGVTYRGIVPPGLPSSVAPKPVTVTPSQARTINAAELIAMIEAEDVRWRALEATFAVEPGTAEARVFCRAKADEARHILSMVRALAGMPLPTAAQLPKAE